MNWDRLIAIIAMLLDAGILWILIAEFNYDKLVYEKDQYKRAASRKKKYVLPEATLTEGESK